MCCLHENRNTPALSISEAKGTFFCFAGCGGGGILQAVVAFGLAANHTEAAAFLAERHLIPATDSSRGSARDREPFVPPTKYTHAVELEDEPRYFRTAALLDMYDAIGPIAMRAVRDRIAVMRRQRDDTERERFLTVCASLARLTEITGRCAHGVVYRAACAECGRERYQRPIPGVA